MRVVYHAFGGRFSDNPRALFEALRRRAADAHEHVWLSDPAHADGFPADVEARTYGSDEGNAALEAADVLIANTHTEVPWRKRDDGLYLQTWHGTPLKRIHWDVLWAPEGRLERLDRDVAMWDVLLSPNAVSTPNLRRAFRYDREVLESGYPRNDVLSSPDRDAVRARVRERLGIPEGTTAVLYAPTWRDDQVFAEGGKAFSFELDVDALCEQLGPDVHLLLRLHYMLTGRLGEIEHPQVRDVSFHPEVSELYLAADVLVTDYSSVMFDFAVTGRPIVFYAYDLDFFRDTLRGFYFDFTEDAPGPVVVTQEALVDALRDLDGVRERFEQPYARFRERFCHLEDGRASERVLDRLLR